MNKDELLIKISSISKIPKCQIQLTSKFSQLPGWDSFMWLELAIELELDGYETITEDIDEIDTIADLLGKLQSHV